MLDSLRLWILWQASLTVFLVLVLLILHAYRSRPFFNYWIVAWSCYSASQFVSLAGVGTPWGAAKALTWATSLLLSATQVWALWMAALSLGGRARFRARAAALLTCLAAGLLVFAASAALRGNPNVSFAVRGFARSSALAVAFLYTALAIRRWKPWAGSVGTLVVVNGCAAYAVLKIVEVGVVIYVGSAGLASPFLHNLFVSDVLCEFIIVTGMCRLLVEKSRAFRQRLELFESILPVCCVCGAVRDDPPGGHGRGTWMSMYEFVAKYSPVRFSHGYCPRCFPLYFAERRAPEATNGTPSTAGRPAASETPRK